MNKKLKSKKVNTNKGITLIALIITIIVLLILAVVAIRAVQGEGILNYASDSKIKYENGQVNEALQLSVYNWKIENAQNNTSTKVIDYLQEKEIISDQYVINVEKLIGRKLSTGNGTFESKKDIYVLEEKKTEITASGVVRLASAEMVKIAQTDSSDEIVYDLVYYDKKGEGNVIGSITDIKVKEMITFTVYSSDEEVVAGPFTVESGTTWYEFCQSSFEGNVTLSCFDVGADVKVVLIETPLRQSSLMTAEGDYVCGSEEITESTYFCEESWTIIECVPGDTKILTDLSNHCEYAKDVSEGDKIVYYNFETNQLEEGTVLKTYIHKDATDFVKYTFEDGSYLEATSYHPIYTKEGWKSFTRRNGYELPKIGDQVKTQEGWKTLSKIEEYKGLEDCYDFAIQSKNGETITNYFANGTLVQSSIH